MRSILKLTQITDYIIKRQNRRNIKMIHFDISPRIGKGCRYQGSLFQYLMYR